MSAHQDDRWLAGDAYEAYMGRWSRPLARAFVEWLDPAPMADWLEVGCGTGALTAAICELGDPASIVACDPSVSFIEHARQNLDDARVSFVVAGVNALPRRESGFDLAVSGLALNFLPGGPAAVAAILERLRPGGTLAAYVWDYSAGMELLRIFWDEATALDGKAAEVDEGRRFPLCRVEALRSLFRDAGLGLVESVALEIATVFSSFDDYWTPFLRGTGPAPAYVAAISQADRETLRERLRTRLSARGTGAIPLRARAWAVRGVI